MKQSRTYSIVLAKLAVPALVGLLFAACSSNGQSYFPKRDGYIPTPEQNKVDVSEMDHEIELSPSQDSLTATQINDLNSFLASNGKNYGDHIEIHTALSSGLGQGPSPTARIADDLRSAFIRGGYLSTRVHLIDEPGATNSVEVSIERYKVVLPDCTAEKTESKEGWNNEPVGMRPLGCSNERNLGLMVADPRDLTGYREVGPASGIREVGAIVRYNTDQVKDPNPVQEKSVTTTSSK